MFDANEQEQLNKQGQSTQLDTGRFPVRTDLAREAHDMAVQEQESPEEGLPGVRIQEEEEEGVVTSWIYVESEEGEKAIGKAQGTYLTLEVPGLRSQDSMLQERVMKKFTQEFERYLGEVGIDPNASVLIVGLGNQSVTADALGPNVVKQSMVTRHLFQLMPDQVAEGYRPVSAIAPGVLGTTGIETSEVIFGVVERTKPDVIIAVDSLASRALSRVNTTIQVSDVGIFPGSGVGNKRLPLNQDTLGIPVIAIGIPTVVDAATIAHDTAEYVLAHIHREMNQEKPTNPLDPMNRASVKELHSQEISPESRQHMMGIVGGLEADEKQQLIQEVLEPLGQNLIVTPKEVDAFIGDMGKVVALGMNCALHDAVTPENVSSHSN
ncbi:GPR endopeptidase Aspartic peptidase. MEROPS family A25 [Marininema mesophilum]|uniref:Germination protease n=1 Tax=Marininema mesophilum TaxID=1048340 RepID=A0A1H2R955_9BACL|nr:GPR endopeptidase [Marininema mesophilum]SDW15901.1 GPR endopeptidase Aspartic peptidase. MEROPS family A25 [Marininema mesophilum]